MSGFSLVRLLVLIRLIRAIMEQSINNKLVSKMPTTDIYLH